MGCANSKIDDLPAVILCRERCRFLDEAIHQRFALSEAHVAYTHSLKSIGDCLHRFIEHDLHGIKEPLSPKKKLNLPPQRKGDPLVLSGDDEGPSSPKKPGPGHHLPVHSRSKSNSGSHLHFYPDSDDDSEEEDDDEVLELHRTNHASPPRNYDGAATAAGGDGDGDGYGYGYGYGYGQYIGGSVYGNDGFQGFYQGGEGGVRMNYMKKETTASLVVYERSRSATETVNFGVVSSSDTDKMGGQDLSDGGGSGGVILHVNYMKNKAGPPPVVYEQRPVMSETIHFGEASSSSYYYPNSPYRPSSSASYPFYGYSNSNYGGGDDGGGGVATRFYGSPSNSGGASSSKLPPPPPSPPNVSTLDFLNVFNGYDTYYPPYTPSRDSKEVREEEGIPDLEDEDYQHEVVKEVHGDNRHVSADTVGNYSKSVMMDDEDGKVGDEADASLYESRPSASMENDAVEYDVHVVEKKVVHDERSGEGNRTGFKAGSRGASEVAIEIKIQFERAAESGNEIAQLLEAGKLRYQRKYVSKMLHGVTPSLSVIASQPSASRSGEPSLSTGNAGPPALEIDEDLSMRSKNLSSTLQKLYLWEKKLYNEVKAEEKMRVVHDRKCRKLKRLDERGAEAHKVDATRTLIRSLSTKIRMAIQVVDKISITINKIRDEELWPQLNDLIQGLTRMWKHMLECHRSQCLAIREARGLGPLGSAKMLGDAHLDVTLELEHELINWTSSFTSWIGAQRGFVRALNNWLVKCLWYEPEETPDGVVPFSPGRLGAPPVFVICNQWAQAFDRISEKEVLDAMRIFAASIFHMWEQDKVEMRQRMVASKDLERKIRNLDREDQKIQKEIQALGKKIVLVAGDGSGLSLTGNVVYQSETRNSSLQGSLQHIFEAMERFTADSLKAYEDLVQRSEEERVAQRREIAS